MLSKVGMVTYFCTYMQIQQNTGKVVNDQSVFEFDSLSVGHVHGQQFDHQQVGGCDGQCGGVALHQEPVRHAGIWGNTETCGDQTLYPTHYHFFI